MKWKHAESNELIPCKKGCKTKGPHAHCIQCGYPVAITEKWCGECLCEEDAIP